MVKTDTVTGYGQAPWSSLDWVVMVTNEVETQVVASRQGQV